MLLSILGSWYVNSEWWLVIIAAATALIAAITAGFIYWQALETRRATQAMRDSGPVQEQTAKAALLNAEAAINAERPWMVIEIRQPYMGFDFIFEAKNYGRTPAEITSYDAKFVFVENVEALPASPRYSSAILAHRKLIPPRGRFPVYTYFGTTVLPEDVRRDLVETKRKVAIYGNVRYLDVLHQEHETRFCFWFGPDQTGVFGSLVVGGPEGYNQHT